MNGLAKDEAARKGPVLGIILDDFATMNAGENLIQGKRVSMGLLIRVIRDPDAVPLDGLDEIFDLHV